MYQDLEATLHDHFWDSEPDANELPLLEHFLQLHPGKSLEIGCGSGRLLLPLLAKGYSIDGVEISADMCALFRQKAEALGLSAKVLETDILQYETIESYAAFTIPAFTLQLFSRATAQQLFHQLRSLAQPDAGLYFTVFIPWAEILDELEPGVWNPDKEAPLASDLIARCETRHYIDRVMQTLSRDHRYTIHNAQGKLTQQHKAHQDLQWYLLPELTLMLQLAGWKLQQHHADFELDNQDSDAATLTLFASAS